MGCWRGLRDIPPWNTNYIPKKIPTMRAALTSPGKHEVEEIPSSLEDLIPPSLHPGIPWDLFLNPDIPRRFLEWGEVSSSAVFSRNKSIHQVGKLSLKMDQGFGTRISSQQLGTEGYQEFTARSSFISYPKNHEFGKRGKKFSFPNAQ